MTGTRFTAVAGLLLVTVLLAPWVNQGCQGGVVNSDQWGDAGPPPECTGGTDKDGDRFGQGCPAGDDCNDDNALVNPRATEVCDNIDNDCDKQIDESGGNNSCGSCSGSCDPYGANKPFPFDKKTDSNLKDTTGVKLDPNGDLVLDNSAIDFNYMWISNTYDTAGPGSCATSSPSSAALCRGTISKIDTKAMKEVARYFTVTCKSQKGSTSCVDVNGKAIKRDAVHTPSRTAVDFNFDVWVANRSVHGGQPSATKIANDVLDCIDRNNNGIIDTSKDQDGDGKINIDCDGNGTPDDATTKCSNAKNPEFLGDDDECILFTVNVGDVDDVSRAICLDTGKSMVGASNAWVGTFYRPENGRGHNRFYMLNGYTGKIEATVDLPGDHHTYGCMADQYHIIWSTDIGTSWYKSGQTKTWTGSLAYFQGVNPYSVGKILRGGSTPTTPWKDPNGDYRHYGISIDGNGHVWLAGYVSPWVLRYKPNRSSFATLGSGTWTRINLPTTIGGSTTYTRGIAADSRGKVWVAVQEGGYILRLNQSVSDGVHDMTTMKDYWPLKADTVIGVGVDFDGNVWGIGQKNNTASKIFVDSNGNVLASQTGTKDVAVGHAPYTYSDFTGYGLINFVRPSGRYIYQLKACADGVKAQWKQISWKATTPLNTSVAVRVRAGDSDTTFGSWSVPFMTSPGVFGPTSPTAISPNPSKMLQVEFTLSNKDKVSTPTLHEYSVSYTCMGNAT